MFILTFSLKYLTQYLLKLWMLLALRYKELCSKPLKDAKSLYIIYLIQYIE